MELLFKQNRSLGRILDLKRRKLTYVTPWNPNPNVPEE